MIRPATAADYYRFFPQAMPAQVLEIDGELLAIGGVFEHHGRLWAYLDIKGELPAADTLRMIRALKDGIRQAGQDVFIACDDSLATAKKLLRILGFVETDEFRNVLRVWKCQV